MGYGLNSDQVFPLAPQELGLVHLALCLECPSLTPSLISIQLSWSLLHVLVLHGPGLNSASNILISFPPTALI